MIEKRGGYKERGRGVIEKRGRYKERGSGVIEKRGRYKYIERERQRERVREGGIESDR